MYSTSAKKLTDARRRPGPALAFNRALLRRHGDHFKHGRRQCFDEGFPLREQVFPGHIVFDDFRMHADVFNDVRRRVAGHGHRCGADLHADGHSGEARTVLASLNGDVVSSGAIGAVSEQRPALSFLKHGRDGIAGRCGG